MSPGSVISVMHEFTLLTVGGMKKLYDKDTIGTVLTQCLKFCAPCLSIVIE